MDENITVAEKQLVVFNLDKEAYALDIAVVREIIHLPSVTKIPGTSSSVKGVINLRGSIIPIIDLRKQFQLGEIERKKDTRVVVVNCRGTEIGIIVDSVNEVLRIPEEAIKAAADFLNGKHPDYLTGVVKLADRLVILLDIDKLLSNKEVAVMNT